MTTTINRSISKGRKNNGAQDLRPFGRVFASTRPTPGEVFAFVAGSAGAPFRHFRAHRPFQRDIGIQLGKRNDHEAHYQTRANGT